MTRNPPRGFSLLELLTVVAIIFILAALSLPRLMTQVYNTRIHYSANNVSGQLQRTRMEAVRKNSFYTLTYSAGPPAQVTVSDRSGNTVTTIPPAVLGANVTGYYGTGSGAPSESSLVTTLGFTPASNTSGSPGFNSRGLPCVPSGQVCTPIAGQGFVFFVSGPIASNGSLGWAAVVVTPSGRCQVWVFDGTSWTQN